MASDTAPPATFAALGEEVRRRMERLRVPGVAAGVIHDGEEETAGFGVTSVETRLPVDADTILQCGSITKVFTSTAVMQLAERGQIELDAPVRAYLPEFRVQDADASERVTVRQLLTHMGGWWGDNFQDTGKGDDALARYVADCARLPQIAPLGELWAYNNASFSIAGRVIEVVTGKVYETALREMLIDPLGMADTVFHANDAITRRFAVGHTVLPEGTKVARPWEIVRGGHPSGGVAPTVCDLLKFARFHLGDGTTASGERLLTRASIEEMRRPHVAKGPAAAPNLAMGYAWDIDEIDGVRVVSKGGGTNGQVSLLTLVPERGFALALLTNGSTGLRFVLELTDWALDALCGVRRVRPRAIEGHAADRAEYAGVYESPGFQQIEVSVDGDALVRRPLKPDGTPAGPPVRGVLCAPDRIIDADGPGIDLMVADFLRDRDGAVRWLRVGGRALARVPAE